MSEKKRMSLPKEQGMLGSDRWMATTLEAGSDQRSLLTFPGVGREDRIFRHAQVCEKSDSNCFSVVEM